MPLENLEHLITDKARPFSKSDYYGYAGAGAIELNYTIEPHICTINSGELEIDILLSGDNGDKGISIQVMLTDEDYEQQCYGIHTKGGLTLELIFESIDFYNGVIKFFNNEMPSNIEAAAELCKKMSLQRLM